jgi:hypothetical protein
MPWDHLHKTHNDVRNCELYGSRGDPDVSDYERRGDDKMRIEPYTVGHLFSSQ